MKNPPTTISWNNTLPVRAEVDVFVAGGGPAGTAAAVMAAREGASVFLAENTGCLGGMGTGGVVAMFQQFSDGVNFLVGGFGRELYDMLEQHGGMGYDNHRDEYKSCTLHAEILKRVYDDLFVASGATLSLFTQFIGVLRDGRRVTHAVCAAKSGLFAIGAKYFVDATGDGDLAAKAGADFEKGDGEGNMMPGTLCTIWSNIDWDAVYKSGMQAQDYVPEGLRQGILKVEDPHLPGIWRVGKDFGSGNVGHMFGVDATDERSLTKSVLEARRMIGPYHEFYKKILKGFERMELAGTAQLPGIRESRRIVCDYRMTAADYDKRATFPDEIGRYSYPLDLHASKPGTANFKAFWSTYKGSYYKPGENYGIPYRTLTPAKLDNVYVSGRCVDCDRVMLSSLRVMPCCFITGQAAGVAAAMAAQGGVSTTRDLEVAALQQRLKAVGAFLPNC